MNLDKEYKLAKIAAKEAGNFLICEKENIDFNAYRINTFMDEYLSIQ